MQRSTTNTEIHAVASSFRLADQFRGSSGSSDGAGTSTMSFERPEACFAFKVPVRSTRWTVPGTKESPSMSGNEIFRSWKVLVKKRSGEKTQLPIHLMDEGWGDTGKGSATLHDAQSYHGCMYTYASCCCCVSGNVR